MKEPGRVSAAISVLTAFEACKRPLKICLADWGRDCRYAGAADRAFVSGLVKDSLRHKSSLAWRMGDDSPRSLVLATLRFAWQWDSEKIASIMAATPYGPGALHPQERAQLSNPRALREAPDSIKGNYPAWLTPSFAQSFGVRAVNEGLALCQRAPLDLRVNTVKCDTDKALKATNLLGASASPLSETGLRIAAAEAYKKAPNIEGLPAFAKGHIEIQDLGSQVAALAVAAEPGQKVLDLCAGGGGKTLALAATMQNKGQIFAYDAEARRLAPIFRRLQKAGIRNTQIRSPAAGHRLEDLASKMDIVLVDAPCSGSGTWRRHPDSKWRLTETHLARRVAEQRQLLDHAIQYIKPGGSLVYVTCSVLHEENEAQIADFLTRHRGRSWEMTSEDSYARLIARPEIPVAARKPLRRAKTPAGALQLTPSITSTDGFFIAVMRLKSEI